MTCTECGATDLQVTHGESGMRGPDGWVVLVKSGEHLCKACRRKRGGPSLQQLEQRARAAGVDR